MTIEISITNTAQERLQAFSADLQGEGTKHAAGRGVRRMLMEYLKGLDSTRTNQIGGKKTHYYADAARNVSYDVETDCAVVRTHQVGLALHYFGGTVKPTGGRRFLTIPVDPEAYGRRAGEFNNLEIAWGRSRDGRIRPIGLMKKGEYKYQTKKNRKTGASEVVSASYEGSKLMYALVYSATIKPDRTILPDDESIQLVALTEMTDYVTTRFRGHS